MPRCRWWLLGACLFAACGGDAPAARGTIEIFSWWIAPGEREALEALITVNEDRNPDTMVVNAAASDADTARARLSTRLAAGNPPDIFQATQGADMLRVVLVNGVDDAESLVEPLDFLRDEEGWAAAFPPSVLDAVSYRGHMYGVPLNIHRNNSLFFNMHVLEEHGIELPRSPEELLTACETLASATPPVPCLAVSARAGWTLTLFFFDALLPAEAGVDFYESYLGGQESADDPRIAAALETFLALYAYAHPDANALTWDQAVELVAQGDAAFTVMGDWTKGYLVDGGLVPGEDFGQVGFPTTGEPTFVYTADAFLLARGAPNRTAGIEFLRSGGSIEGQLAFNLEKGSIPARTDASTEGFDVLGRATAADFASARATRAWTSLVPPRFQDPINEAMVRMVSSNDPQIMIRTLESYYDILQED